jgi:D-alanine-D-alanine ligase-like ATP-grasp enzyme
MQQDEEIELSTRKFTSRLIIERARARGWHVFGFETNRALYLLKIPSRELPIKIFSASPPQMSYAAAKIAEDKYIANQIICREDIPVPEDKLINTSEPLNEQAIDEFLQKYGRVVVKPLDASHGKGITVNIKSVGQLTDACEEAKKYTKRSKVLMQQHIEGNDLRILCIEYEYVAAITRIPASVKGDGTHSVSELIDIENTKDYRGENYRARLNYINKERAEHYLGPTKMSQIPSDGEIVRVIGVANIGMGGERKIITNDIPNFIINMAIKAAKALELPVCAVDFMVAVDPQRHSTQDELKPYLIELNGCPQLLISDDPYSQEQSAFIDRYLDLVAKSS